MCVHVFPALVLTHARVIDIVCPSLPIHPTHTPSLAHTQLWALALRHRWTPVPQRDAPQTLL